MRFIREGRGNIPGKPGLFYIKGLYARLGNPNNAGPVHFKEKKEPKSNN
jgi:hypothetical protein